MIQPRTTGLQAFTLALLGLLDSARRELHHDEYEAILNIVAARLARDFVREYLSDEREQAA